MCLARQSTCDVVSKAARGTCDLPAPALKAIRSGLYYIRTTGGSSKLSAAPHQLADLPNALSGTGLQAVLVTVHRESKPDYWQ